MGHLLSYGNCIKSTSIIGGGERVAWPSGLRRWFKAPVSSEAWVRIPPLPYFFLLYSPCHENKESTEKKEMMVTKSRHTYLAQWPSGKASVRTPSVPCFETIKHE